MIKHFADHWEAVAEIIPDEIAISHAGVGRTWREYESRAARLANALAEIGIGPDSKVAIYSRNSNEYLEAQFAVLKVRGIVINVNYRYLESELTHLFDDADIDAVVFQARFAPMLRAIRSALPRIKTFIEVADGTDDHLQGSADYEALIAATPAMPPITRSEDDLYMFYTGGTTGKPKGVVYRIGDFYTGRCRTFELRGLPRPENRQALASLIGELSAAKALAKALPACPLMHGTGLWLGAVQPHLVGGHVVTVDSPRFDAHALCATIEQERIGEVALVGDAFAKPMVVAAREAQAHGRPYDLSSLKVILSSGVMFSAESKRALLEYCDATIIDAMGATEGAYALSTTSRRSPPTATAQFKLNDTTKVFTEDGREVIPGSGEVGAVASGGVVPLGYFKDPEKSAKTFRAINGHRYSFPGDQALVNEDGTLTLLGRGSTCINSGGEKIFPEEVEEAIKAHPAVRDCLVVGERDERLGERVIAVVSLEGDAPIDIMSIVDEARRRLASYKLPKAVVVATEVLRKANGKPDYSWARQVVEARPMDVTGPVSSPASPVATATLSR